MALASGVALLAIAVSPASAAPSSVNAAGAVAGKPGSSVSTFTRSMCWHAIHRDVLGALTKQGLKEWYRSNYTITASNDSVNVFVTFHPLGGRGQLGFTQTSITVLSSSSELTTARSYRDSVKANIQRIQYIDYC